MKPLPSRKAHIVRIEGIGHHQMWSLCLDPTPKWQIIRIIVSIVFKVIILSHQTTGMFAGPAGIPAGRFLSSHTLVNLNRTFHVLALKRFGKPIIVDPAVAMTGNFVTRFQTGFDHLGVTLHGHRYSKDG